MPEPVIPYGRQSVEEEDVQAVAAVLRGDFLTTGPLVAEFERARRRHIVRGPQTCVLNVR